MIHVVQVAGLGLGLCMLSIAGGLLEVADCHWVVHAEGGSGVSIERRSGVSMSERGSGVE